MILRQRKKKKNYYLPHLKHILCHLYPPAIRSSAAYTDLEHLGHFGCSIATKGILGIELDDCTNKTENKIKIFYCCIIMLYYYYYETSLIITNKKRKNPIQKLNN